MSVRTVTVSLMWLAVAIGREANLLTSQHRTSTAPNDEHKRPDQLGHITLHGQPS
jgi:hypothetical protein